jgi:hypothetical protein
MVNIDKACIEERVKEWKRRLESLYAFVEEPLAALKGVRCEKKRQVTMYEELMQNFDVNSQQLPILDIYRNETLIVSFKSIGLWVIGANGRIDILTEKGAYILVDKAKFGQPAEWNVFSPQNRRSGSPFDSSFILELVRQA